MLPNVSRTCATWAAVAAQTSVPTTMVGGLSARISGTTVHINPMLAAVLPLKDAGPTADELEQRHRLLQEGLGPMENGGGCFATGGQPDACASCAGLLAERERAGCCTGNAGCCCTGNAGCCVGCLMPMNWNWRSAEGAGGWACRSSASARARTRRAPATRCSLAALTVGLR